jgi:hypothetical protein
MDRITSDGPATAVQAQPEPRPAEDPAADTSTGVLDVAKLPTIGDDRLSDQPSHEVARLEDVLTIAPSEAPPADAGALPVNDVELPARDLKSDSDWARLRQQVARLEQLLRITSADQTDRTAGSAAADPEPEYVAAHALREAFWFEQASAFRSSDAPAPPELEPDRDADPITTPEPEPAPREADPRPPAESYGSQPIVDPAQGRPWLAVVCLLALIGLVAVLTGRRSNA